MSEAADVVVVGGGLAGMTAALAAARREPAASVRLVSAAETTLEHASGLIDVLGYVPTQDGPIIDPFQELSALPEAHPYTTVGTAAVSQGLSLFDDVTDDSYRGGHTDRNALVPTYGGATKPTGRYPATVAAGLAARMDDMLLVGFDRLTAFDAPLVADQLAAAGVPFATRGETVRFPGAIDDYPAAPHIARVLDENEPVPRDSGAGVPPGVDHRTALARTVATVHEDEPRVGLPAVLGETDHAEMRTQLATHLDAAVFEVPLGPPSIPGRRLGAQFQESLAEAGVQRTIGRRVTGVQSTGARIEAVVLGEDEPTPVAGAGFVLATGGLAGGGIVAEGTSVREPVFDCHVPAPADRAQWFADTPFGDHEFPRFGVRTDAALRPLDADDEPEYANLHAAGPVIGGYDWPREKSGGGVSLATGHVAGTRAVDAG